MKHRRLVGVLILAFGLTTFATACNSEKLPRLASVTGNVTLGGQPVPNATVIFEGANPGEPPSIGRTDAAGKYELYYSRGHKGATIGEHLVRISTYDETGDDDNRQIQKETIPAKYNSKSELKVNVTRGSNKHDFALEPGGEIIQPGESAIPQKGKKGKK